MRIATYACSNVCVLQLMRIATYATCAYRNVCALQRMRTVTYAHTNVCVLQRIRIATYTYVWASAFTGMCPLAFSHSVASRCFLPSHTRTHTHTHTPRHTTIHPRTQTHAHKHTHRHSCTHTLMHPHRTYLHACLNIIHVVGGDPVDSNIYIWGGFSY